MNVQEEHSTQRIMTEENKTADVTNNSPPPDIEVSIKNYAPDLQSYPSEEHGHTTAYGRVIKPPPRLSDESFSFMKERKRKDHNSAKKQSSVEKDRARDEALILWKKACREVEQDENDVPEVLINLIEKQQQDEQHCENVTEAKDERHQTLQQVKKAKAELVKECKELKHERKELRTKIKELEISLRASKMETVSQEHAYRTQLAEVEQRFANAQKGIADLFKQGATDALTDDFIRGEFDAVKAPCSPWARKCCAKSLENADASFVKKTLSDGTLVQLSHEEQDIQYRAIMTHLGAPRILLNHIVSFEIFGNLFGKAFAFLGNTPHCDGRTLSRLLEYMEASKRQSSSCI
jgi:hypothetical protein